MLIGVIARYIGFGFRPFNRLLRMRGTRKVMWVVISDSQEDTL